MSVFIQQKSPTGWPEINLSNITGLGELELNSSAYGCALKRKDLSNETSKVYFES
jgi:hypothetical protein